MYNFKLIVERKPNVNMVGEQRFPQLRTLKNYVYFTRRGNCLQKNANILKLSNISQKYILYKNDQKKRLHLFFFIFFC